MMLGISTVIVLPVLVWYYIYSLAIGRDSALEGASQLLSILPGRCGNMVRLAFYARVLERCESTATICFGSVLSKVASRIGSHVYIGPYCQLGLVTIGDDTLLGPSVQIPSGPHTHTFDRLDVPIRNQRGALQRVEIGADCWIGAGSIVMANVGTQSVIAAGSVVTKSRPEKSVAVGVPAKVIKTRT
jgi:acetyltransferase-like isoleucine patch superfamily enzyme